MKYALVAAAVVVVYAVASIAVGRYLGHRDRTDNRPPPNDEPRPNGAAA